MEVVLWRCGKYGKFKTKGDEDKEYTRQINIINSKKIGIEYIQKINSQLVQYNSIIEKLKKKENQYNRIKLKTHLSKENLRKITREFFSTVDNDLYNQVDDIFTNGEGVEPYTQDIVLTFIDDSKQGIAHSVKQESQYNDSITDEMIESLKDEDPEMYSMAIRMFRPCILTHITLERLGNILDLHNLSHELTHSFIQRKQKESTLFDESPSFCIETLIDDFLLSLDDEKCKEYGFKKEDLKEDIILKNIVRFFSVGNQVDRLNTEPKNSQELAENQSLLEYVVAQIYQSQFLKLTPEQRKEKIIDLMDGVSKNEFDRINEILGMDWNDKDKWKEYVDKPIMDVYRNFKQYEKILEKSKKTSNNKEQDIR